MIVLRLCIVTLLGIACGQDGPFFKPRKFQDYCLDLPGGDGTNGSPVQLWKCNGGSNQFWRWNADGSIANGQSGYNKCLDLAGGDTSGGAPLQIWDCNGHTNQQWGYAPNPINPKPELGGIIYYKSTGEWSFCIDFLGGEPPGNGKKLTVWKCSKAANDGEPWLT